MEAYYELTCLEVDEVDQVDPLELTGNNVQ
jgi:hypothetical protein